MNSIKQFIKKIPFVKSILAKRNLSMKAHLKKGGSLLQNAELQTINGMIEHLKKGGSLLQNADQKTRTHWGPRIKLVQDSSDNNKINHAPDAGTFNKEGNLIMHNGLLIDPLSYYNFPMLELLFLNRGVHEPQEEYVFQEVLKHMPENSVMLELGAYWSFYSMWFNSEIKNANNFMIEPEDIDSGKNNFELNNMKGDFTKAYILDNSNEVIDGTSTVCIDDFVRKKDIKFIDMLHSDIQGFEFKMLLGAETLLDKKQVGYIFISTHSNELHYQCMDHLESKGYKLVCSYDMNESYSSDGLIVFKNPDYKGLDTINISKR